ASVGRPEDHVACVVDDARVVTRDEDGLRPVEAVLQVRRLVAVRVVRPHADVLRLPGLRIVAGQDPDVLAGVDGAAVGCRRGGAGRAAAYGFPVGGGDRAFFAPAANGDRGVVLLRAVDHVGPLIVRGHVVELRGRLVVLPAPRLAPVHADRGPA